MNPTQKPRVKICCISSIQEAQLAISYGAFAIGLVSEMPSGPGVISESLISEIAATIPPWISSFLLTSKQDTQQLLSNCVNEARTPFTSLTISLLMAIR